MAKSRWFCFPASVSVLVCTVALLLDAFPVHRAIAASPSGGYSHIVNIRTFEELEPYLRTNDPEQLRLAILTTRTIRDPRVPELLSSIWDNQIIPEINNNQLVLRDPRVRLAVASVLLSIGHGDREAYRSYIYKEVNSPNKGIRAYAANALGSIGDRRAVESLVAFIRHDYQMELRTPVSGRSGGYIGTPTLRLYTVDIDRDPNNGEEFLYFEGAFWRKRTVSGHYATDGTSYRLLDLKYCAILARLHVGASRTYPLDTDLSRKQPDTSYHDVIKYRGKYYVYDLISRHGYSRPFTLYGYDIQRRKFSPICSFTR